MTKRAQRELLGRLARAHIAPFKRLTEIPPRFHRDSTRHSADSRSHPHAAQPGALVASGLYSHIVAMPFYDGEHRVVSRVVFVRQTARGLPKATALAHHLAPHWQPQLVLAPARPPNSCTAAPSSRSAAMLLP